MVIGFYLLIFFISILTTVKLYVQTNDVLEILLNGAA